LEPSIATRIFLIKMVHQDVKLLRHIINFLGTLREAQICPYCSSSAASTSEVKHHYNFFEVCM
jgi:hypothetical protein